MLHHRFSCSGGGRPRLIADCYLPSGDSTALFASLVVSHRCFLVGVEHTRTLPKQAGLFFLLPFFFFFFFLLFFFPRICLCVLFLLPPPSLPKRGVWLDYRLPLTSPSLEENECVFNADSEQRRQRKKRPCVT